MKSKPSHQGTQPGAATLGAQAPALPRAPPARLKMGRGSLWAGFWGRNGHFADFSAAWQSHPFSRRKDFVTRRERITPPVTFLLDMEVEYAITYLRRSWRHA